MVSVDFLKVFMFAIRADGREFGVASVSEIDEVVTRAGRGVIWPVDISYAIKVGQVSLGEYLKRGQHRSHNVGILEMVKEGTGRVIWLKGCRLGRFSVAKHDAAEDALVIETVRLHPRRIRVVTFSKATEEELEMVKKIAGNAFLDDYKALPSLPRK